jgi:N-acetylglucosaminyl-diphospho-decaprenol L-rhamnosyltransferase
MELSYCVVNTNGRELLLSCLEAIDRTHPPRIEHEILVLDNASDDGSSEAVARRFPEARLIARDRRAGLAENNSLLLREARGRFCLFLNEDSEMLEGGAEALLEALNADPEAAAAGAQLLDADGQPIPCAWRLPGLGTALAQALFLHRWLVTQDAGTAAGKGGRGREADTSADGERVRDANTSPDDSGQVREVGWVQSAAMLVRREAAQQVGYLDPDFFVYSEEVDFQKRMRDAGWRILHVPDASATHREQLATDRSAGARRVVQFHRGRAMYMRKHHSRPVGLLARILWAWSYVPRAIAAMFMPGHHPGWYWLHARQALRPTRGEGMREAAEAYNAQRASQAGSEAAAASGNKSTLARPR